MIILLQSPSEIARISIAEKIVKERNNWRHIPVEYLGELVEMDDALLPGLFAEGTMLLFLGCQCAKKLWEEEDLHSVLSCADASEMLPSVREDLGEGFYAIHIGEDDEQAAECDYVLEPRLSVNKAATAINQLIEAATGKRKRK